MFRLFDDDHSARRPLTSPGSEADNRDLPLLTGKACNTFACSAPAGNEQTNSARKTCSTAAKTVRGSDTCGVGNGKLIYNLTTKDCDPVETIFGTT